MDVVSSVNDAIALVSKLRDIAKDVCSLWFLRSLTCCDDLTQLAPLADNFGTFEWPRASDLKELVIGSRA